jgi:hypothetical protein
VDGVNSYSCSCAAGYSGTNCETGPGDCSEILKASPGAASGEYTITVGGKQQQVYCDMTTKNGGWTVIQRRKDGTENFYRGWNDYAAGFGSVGAEFWLGNDNIAALTAQKRYVLRVDLRDKSGNTFYTEYDNFRIDGASEKYKLASIGSYTGNIGDGLDNHGRLARYWTLGMKFTTYDNDNDFSDFSEKNCAILCRGAWWYNACYGANLNGKYDGTNYTGVQWDPKKSEGDLSYKFSEMKIRPY